MECEQIEAVARREFDRACTIQDKYTGPGKTWDECEEWVRQMWREVATGTYVSITGSYRDHR